MRQIINFKVTGDKYTDLYQHAEDQLKQLFGDGETIPHDAEFDIHLCESSELLPNECAGVWAADVTIRRSDASFRT
jgi:hypothetical protein